MNEKLFSSCEISSIGKVGTMSLLHGAPAKLLNFIGRALAYTEARAYGCFLLSFGIASLLLNFGSLYFTEATELSVSTLIICAALVVLSIPLLVFARPMCIALQDFPLTDMLFFDFLAIKRMRRNVSYTGINPIAASVIGLIPATLAYLFSMEIVILTLIMLVVVNVAFATPEFSMLISLLFFPYIMFLEPSGVICALLSLLTFLSFATKVIIGKRVFNLSLCDVLMFLFMLSLLVFGLVSGESARGVLVTCSVILSYFPISNLIVNRRLAECAKKALIFSAIPIAVSAIVEFIISKADSSRGGEITSVFEESASLVAFLLASLVLAFVYASERTHRHHKIIYFSVFVLEAVALGVMTRPESIIVVLLAGVAYPILKSRKIPIDVLAILVLLPYAIFLVPSSLLDRVSDAFGLTVSLTDEITVYRNMFSELSENLWLGVGPDSIIGANTFLGLTLGFGVFSVLLFSLLILLKLRHVSYFRVYMRNSDLGPTGEMAALAIVTLLLYGVFYNIFSDYTVVSLFVALFAISSAALRTARREYDDRMGYYDDSSSSDSSALDVSVNSYN